MLFGDSAFKFGRPLSIYRLASHLRKNGITCQPLWAWSQISSSDFQKICQKFLSSETEVVGISTTLLKQSQRSLSPSKSSFWGIPTEELISRIKLIRNLAPNAKLVVGGSQLPAVPLTSIPCYEQIDCFVTGQGENSLLAIIEAQQNKKRLQTLQPNPPLITQEQYPYNDFVNSTTEYAHSDAIVPGEAMGYEFARGCIFKCSFCTYDLTGKNKNDYNKSVDLITNELKKNYDQHGITHYIAVDDLLNDSEDKINVILDVAERLPFDLTYSAFVRLDMLRRFPTMASKLKQSGLVGAFMGIETINDASGKSVGKGLGKQRINEALAVVNESWNNEIVVEGSFILGLPHDNAETKYELLEWLQSPVVKKAIQYISINALGINSYRKISEIDINPESFGYTFDSNGRWQLGSYTWQQATEDSNWVRTQYYADRKYNASPGISVFNLPHLLSITDCRQDVLDVVLHDRSTRWNSRQEWLRWTTQQFEHHRKRCIDLLLER